EVLLREIVRASPDVAALRDRLRGVPTGAAPSEQLRLGQLVEAEIERRRAEDTAIARDRLEPLARAARQDEARQPVALDPALLAGAQRGGVRASRERPAGAADRHPGPDRTGDPWPPRMMESCRPPSWRARPSRRSRS